MEKTKIALFVADFDHQVGQISRIYARIESRAEKLEGKKVSAETVESSAYWLHNLYCAYEDLFKIVSAFWENNVQSDGSFHKSLLRRMLLTIEGVRPALLDEKSYRYLDELRSFRHVFRHAYSYGLDDERVVYLLTKVLQQKQYLLAELAAFRKTVAMLLD